MNRGSPGGVESEMIDRIVERPRAVKRRGGIYWLIAIHAGLGMNFFDKPALFRYASETRGPSGAL